MCASKWLWILNFLLLPSLHILCVRGKEPKNLKVSRDLSEEHVPGALFAFLPGLQGKVRQDRGCDSAVWGGREVTLPEAPLFRSTDTLMRAHAAAGARPL